MFDSFLNFIKRPEILAIVAVLGLLLALLSNTHVRRFLGWVFYKILNVLGFTRWVYRRKFLKRHSVVQNIYLDREETLDLRATYIPLHVDRPGQSVRVPAVQLLSDPNERRLIIVGDPGTGKTTLIKAFGTGILSPFTGLRPHEALHVKRRRETPIIVYLRHFAATDYANLSLAEYIINHVFRDQMQIKDGATFLRSLLRKEQCLVLLDGLDEVSDANYKDVKTRVSAFCTGTIPGFETAKARIVMTCRKQNFERLRTDWIPVPFREALTLVPLDTDEVYRFLTHRKSEFGEGRTPELFFNQIQASAIADMHRNPLILTISLGLYLNTPKYEIPGSVAQFYETMVLHLLRRHDFRTQPDVKGVNQYKAEDKYRFLREFALEMSTRESGFDEFSYREIKKIFDNIHEKMADVAQQDADTFIREIINRSGLLAKISDDDVYIFAHRSIHEYFIAVQLARTPVDGKDTLLAKASNLRWRQVIVFFASLDHEQVEPFLTELMHRNLELAGYCAPAAQVVPRALAEELADRLVADIRGENAAISLPALISMTTSQRNQIRDTAMGRLQVVLKEVFDAQSYQLTGLKDEDVPELLTQLANTGSINVVPTCLRLSELSSKPNDAIAPLWQCLSIPGIDQQKDLCRRIIRFLLDAVMTPAGLEELISQPTFAPDFITDDLRAEVYPFSRGHEANSNLVTLLAWAERMEAIPSDPNEFFLAKQQQSDAWRRVERDRNRFTFRVHWYPFVFSMSVAAFVFPLIYLSYRFFFGFPVLLPVIYSKQNLLNIGVLFPLFQPFFSITISKISNDILMIIQHFLIGSLILFLCLFVNNIKNIIIYILIKIKN